MADKKEKNEGAAPKKRAVSNKPKARYFHRKFTDPNLDPPKALFHVQAVAAPNGKGGFISQILQLPKGEGKPTPVSPAPHGTYEEAEARAQELCNHLTEKGYTVLTKGGGTVLELDAIPAAGSIGE